MPRRLDVLLLLALVPIAIVGCQQSTPSFPTKIAP